MKKLLLFFVFLVGTALNAQQSYTILNEDTGNNLNDGDVITVSNNHFTTNLIITNNSSVPFKATLEVLNIINTDGSEMSFCFGFHGGGNCYFRMDNGQTYDSNANNNQYLQPGESTASDWIDFTHTENGNFTNYPKDYELKLTIYNANDNSIIGVTNFTYRYDPGAGAINTFNKSDIVISTAHRHTIIIDSKYVAHVNLFNLTGQKVKEVTLKPDQNHIYTGSLASGIYILHVKSGGKELYKKIILK